MDRKEMAKKGLFAIDDLGRIYIPLKIRKQMGISDKECFFKVVPQDNGDILLERMKEYDSKRI